MSIITKYRPGSWDEFVGNEALVNSLQNELKKKDRPHSYLFHGSSGTGKCIIGDSLIYTACGLKNIEIFGSGKNGFIKSENLILNETSELEYSSHFYEEIAESTIKITNNLGLSIQGTHEHPILVINKNCDFEYRQLSDINIGDFACISRKAIEFNGDTSIEYIEQKRKCDTNSISLCNIPNKINEEIARLLGYIIANATNNSANSDHASIEFSTSNIDIRNDIQNIITKLGMDIGKVYNNKDFKIGGVHLYRFICSIMDCERIPTARFKTIPKMILQSSMSIRIQFLRGLIDCDSYIRPDGTVLYYYTASSILANQVQMLLLTLGIVSKKTVKRVSGYDHNYWSISISGAELDKYFTLAGSIKYKPKEIRRNTNIDIIPYAGNIISKLLNEISIPLNIDRYGRFIENGIKKISKLKTQLKISNLTNSKNISYNTLSNIYNTIISTEIQHENISKIAELCNSLLSRNYFFSKITNIELVNENKRVYDFCMPTSHSFIANGFVNHNTTLARLIAKELNCTEQNIIEYNIADNTSVENAREIARSAKYVPLVNEGESKIKIYILDEFHRASPNAQDCLLKPLEEPPDHAYFVICTTEPSKVIKTIRSRCSEYEVRPLDSEQMMSLLETIIEKEEAEEIDYKILKKIIKASEGRAREALSLLGQIIEIEDEEQALELINLSVENASVIEICRAFSKRNDRDRWKTIAALLSRLKEDPEKCRLGILNYFANIMINTKTNSSMIEYSALIAECFEQPFYNSGRGGLILACYKACQD